MDAKATPRRGKKTIPMALNNELFDRSTLRERRRQALFLKLTAIFLSVPSSPKMQFT